MNMNEIHVIHLFKRLIHSGTKQVVIFMNESLNHWLTRLVSRFIQ